MCTVYRHKTHGRYTVYTGSHSQSHRYPQAPSCKLLISLETWKKYIYGKDNLEREREELNGIGKLLGGNLSLGERGGDWENH
jgi:hypothetical protein